MGRGSVDRGYPASLDKSTLINRVKNATPTFGVFDTNPANPELITDGDMDTESGEGVKTLAAPGDVGTIIFDMGAAYPVLVLIHMNVHRASGDGTLYAVIDRSDDNFATWAASSSIGTAISSDAYRGWLAIFLYARYFRIRVVASSTTVSSVYNVKCREVMALQLL